MQWWTELHLKNSPEEVNAKLPAKAHYQQKTRENYVQSAKVAEKIECAQICEFSAGCTKDVWYVGFKEEHQFEHNRKIDTTYEGDQLKSRSNVPNISNKPTFGTFGLCKRTLTTTRIQTKTKIIHSLSRPQDRLTDIYG